MSLQKRLFDLFFASVGILLLSPLFLVIGLIIKMYDGGPIFYRQERVGRNGKPFRIWKFRSMVVDAEKMGSLLTAGRDPRITPVGYWLRRLKLDELPQLLNVLAGEMSLVGPRPEVQRYVDLYTPEQRRVLELTPGITDIASIEYRNEQELLALSPDPELTYIREIMPHKIKLNLAYAEKASVWTDLVVILRTLVAIFR